MKRSEQPPARVVPRPALPGLQAPPASPASPVSQDEPGAHCCPTRHRATPAGSYSGRVAACGCALIRKRGSFRVYLTEKSSIRYVIEHGFQPSRLGIPIHSSFRFQTLVMQIGELAPIIKFFKVPEANTPTRKTGFCRTYGVWRASMVVLRSTASYCGKASNRGANYSLICKIQSFSVVWRKWDISAKYRSWPKLSQFTRELSLPLAMRRTDREAF